MGSLAPARTMVVPDETTEIAGAIRAVRAGDRDAYRVIVDRFAARLTRFARGLVGSDAGAEDLAQSAFVRAHARLGSYDERRPFFPWLAKIAVRLAQDRWAEEARTARAAGALDDAPAPSATSPQHQLEEAERRHQLWSTIDTLPRAERAAVLLYYREELGVDEVARVLGVSPGTIKTLLFRARARLRSLLEERHELR